MAFEEELWVVKKRPDPRFRALLPNDLSESHRACLGEVKSLRGTCKAVVLVVPIYRPRKTFHKTRLVLELIGLRVALAVSLGALDEVSQCWRRSAYHTHL